MTDTIEYTSEIIRSHNGKVTIENPETGQHRTFRIRTQSPDSKFKPGQRLVGLLTGPEDWTNFGHIVNGRIIIWRKFQNDSSLYSKYSEMLTRPDDFKKLGANYLFAGKCIRCNRTLTNPESIRSGIGPVCAGM